MIVKFLDKLGNLVKSITSIAYIPVDVEPVEGSKHLLSSGAGANISSNFAPNYTKQTYEANSYVMHDGVLYTNPNAIGTAEDWNPAHWTQTTVAEMMAGAGATQWTNRTVNLTINGGDTEQIDIQDHEFVDLTILRGSPSGIGHLNMHLYGECYVLVDKGYNVDVKTLIGDSSTETNDVDSGVPYLNKDGANAMYPTSSGIPDVYNPYDFDTGSVLGLDTNIEFDKPSLMDNYSMQMLLHFLGEGTLIITHIPF